MLTRESYRRANLHINEQAVLSMVDETAVAPYVTQLLMAYFKKKSDALLIQADVSATPADIERTLSLPDSPRLIVLGNTLMTAEKWMLSIEGQVVCKAQSSSATFVSGMAAVFASFYNFNLQYQEETVCMLEFIQRTFLGINPEGGSKARYGKVIKSWRILSGTQCKNMTAVMRIFFLVEFTVPGLESVCFQPRAEPFYGSWVFQKVFLFFR
ncbi:hypothetical protein ANANG_G00101340 [Anguilla anguilla]|uniref:Uncharacterized protein n=1 Tax=Anguilla anguilla TaxID=7936 RepID=A0A9D3MGW0_ANGAN|nr:hypothetical protein ANANG_G00101340 [Anguilla anguilla]